jgi:hypothetical protein
MIAIGLGAACGGGSRTSDPVIGKGDSDPGTNPPLAMPAVAFGGGPTSAGGQGKAGGTAHLVSKGGITIGPDFQMPDMSQAAAPGDAMMLGAGKLDADVNAPGAISIPGNVTAGGTDGVRQITAGGDIFVDGTLRAADLGAARQGLSLKAPNGTVFVKGTIDTSGASGGGQSGGALTIVAQRLVVSGHLVTAGGDAHGGMATQGGRAGDLTIQMTADVALGGDVSVRGGGVSGGAQATGGDAGTVAIDAGGTVGVSAKFDGRGGSATANSAAATIQGGAAGTLKVGEATQPQMIGFAVPLLLNGGYGASAGGNGGSAHLEAHGGDLRISGVVDVTGGGSLSQPGPGGTIMGNPGPEGATAAIDVAGQVIANGGAVASGGSGAGAAGGLIKLVSLASDGALTLEPAGEVQADGGDAHGAGTAGAGGLIYLFTIHGGASIHGKVLSRGGAASDPGGTGGGGGFIYIFTGDGHDRLSGVLTIESDGVVDASGGNGTVGGSARNDGHAGSVGEFPTHQDDEYGVDNIAVLINSDGVHGADHGYLDNQGTVIARGGAANGSGGDVAYHGRRADGNETPLPGNIDLSPDGTGMEGDFAGE